MNTIKTVIATIALSLPLTVFAEGGKLWETKMEAKESHLKKSIAAQEMGHTAAQHKYWMTDDATAPADSNYKLSHRHAKPHAGHMASDHKRDMVGSNN